MGNSLESQSIELWECARPGERSEPDTTQARLRVPPLGEAEVHVYSFSLAQPQQVLARLASLFSVDERERACRFHFEVHSSRFMAGRGLLRLLLGHHLDTEPAGLNFTCRPAGKPELDPPHSGLHFNLAHCEDCALLAITRLGPLGVDLERVRELPDFEELVGRFFSVREATAFARLLPAQKPRAFFNLWTRKEAWLKATGDGIAEGLDKVEVSFLPGEAARVLALPGDDAPEAWTVRELQFAAGFVAALAIRQPTFSIINVDFTPLP
jgi:4'-phosphopantetheinyl transferase